MATFEQIRDLQNRVNNLQSQIERFEAKQEEGSGETPPAPVSNSQQERRDAIVMSTLLDHYNGNREKANAQFARMKNRGSVVALSANNPQRRDAIVMNELLVHYKGDQAKANAQFQRMRQRSNEHVVAMSALYKQGPALTRMIEKDPEREAEAQFAELSKGDQECVMALRGGPGGLKPMSVALSKFASARARVLQRMR